MPMSSPEGVPGSDIECEKLVEIDRQVMEADELYAQRREVLQTVNGQDFVGTIVDMFEGEESKETLYLIKYEDGDIEHMNKAEVGKRLLPIGYSAGKQVEIEDEEEPEEEDGGRKNAVFPALKAKAVGKKTTKASGKGAGKNVGKVAGKNADENAGKAAGKAACKAPGKTASKAAGKAAGKVVPKAAAKAVPKAVPKAVAKDAKAAAKDAKAAAKEAEAAAKAAAKQAVITKKPSGKAPQGKAVGKKVMAKTKGGAKPKPVVRSKPAGAHKEAVPKKVLKKPAKK